MADKRATGADDTAAGDGASGRGAAQAQDKAVAGPRAMPRPAKRCPSCGGPLSKRADDGTPKAGRWECDDCREHFIAAELD